MAEPVRRLPDPDLLDDDETSAESVLQRWFFHPDGRAELLEFPLTPELFLDPQLEDKMVQGRRHSLITRRLADLLDHHFEARPDVLVLSDVKHYLGVPGLPAPAPDVSVIQGLPFKDYDPDIFDVAVEGVRPSLVLEVVSPKDARLRRADQIDKVEVYSRAGIPEYILVDSPRRATKYRFQLTGYRLDAQGNYQRIEPDPQGRLFSETTNLWFAVSPQGDRILVTDAATGQPLPERFELVAEARRETQARKAAEKKARREAEARKAAEAELARLREELARLKGGNSR